MGKSRFLKLTLLTNSPSNLNATSGLSEITTTSRESSLVIQLATFRASIGDFSESVSRSLIGSAVQIQLSLLNSYRKD